MSYEMNRRQFEEAFDHFRDVVFGEPCIETLPPLMVWTLDDQDRLDVHLASVWTWDEAIRYAKGSAIIAHVPTRIVVLS